MYHEVNIREELLPRLVKDGNFSTVSERFTKIQKCDIVRLSSSEAFMLTMCYRIKLTLSTEDNFHSKEFNLVLKVRDFLTIRSSKPTVRHHCVEQFKYG